MDSVCDGAVLSKGVIRLSSPAVVRAIPRDCVCDRGRIVSETIPANSCTSEAFGPNVLHMPYPRSVRFGVSSTPEPLANRQGQREIVSSSVGRIAAFSFTKSNIGVDARSGVALVEGALNLLEAI